MKEGVLSLWASRLLASGPQRHLQQVGTLGCPSASNVGEPHPGTE